MNGRFERANGGLDGVNERSQCHKLKNGRGIAAPGRFEETGAGWKTALHLADDFRPVGVEELAAWLVGPLVGVGTEEVALGLEQVRGKDGATIEPVMSDKGTDKSPDKSLFPSVHLSADLTWELGSRKTSGIAG